VSAHEWVTRDWSPRGFCVRCGKGNPAPEPCSALAEGVPERRAASPLVRQAAEVLQAARKVEAARAALRKASEARRALPPGTSRARVTSANARWATKAEACKRAEDALAVACAALESIRSAGGGHE
jgi:hypothetical protein